MIRFGFTGKKDGDMVDDVAVQKYLQTYYSSLKGIVRPRQVHGTHIEIVRKADGLVRIPDTDGLITTLPNVALTVVTADCVPIVYYDENCSIIGISHQGWRGLMEELPVKMLNEMRRAGCSFPDLRIIIGPSINDCCYKVPQERFDAFQKKFPETKAVKVREGVPAVNLTELAVEQIKASGLDGGNIIYTIDCTSCQEDKYYSFRKAENKKMFSEQMGYIVNI